MSRNHPLSYPAPVPSERTFDPLKLISDAPSRRFLFDVIFGHPLMGRMFKPMSRHAILPLIIGALIAATGHRQMRWSSLGVVLCAVWLSLEIGVWIFEKKTWRSEYKAMLSCACTCILCCLAMMVMYRFLLDTLEDQRNDVCQNLAFSHHMLPGEEDNPMHTIFTVTNNSPYTISKKHHIGCELLLAVIGNGHGYIQAQGRPIVADPDSKLWIAPAAGDLSPMHAWTQSTMGPGSDAESSECLIWFGAEGAECVDLKVIFWYSLENQPDFDEEKKVRYVAVKSKDGRFSWVSQSVESPKMYCADFYKGPSQPPFR